ncbi:hypothetical protein Hdeb2414_s0001g00019401 [Helianthus debilis subsp. tardiflorus]
MFTALSPPSSTADNPVPITSITAADHRPPGQLLQFSPHFDLLFVSSTFRMSGEGSSSGVKHKRRGTRAQGAAQEQPADTLLREITYRDDGTPHGQSSRLVDSPLLRFTVGFTEYMKFDTIKKLKLLGFRRIDWDLVGQLGQVERLQELLGPNFRMALDCDTP